MVKIEVKQEKVRVEENPDIVYGQVKNQKGTIIPLRMSILAPQNNGIKPAILFFPGGGFTEANYHKDIQVRFALAESGFVVVSAEYRVIPNRFPAPIHDGKMAINYLRTHANMYHIDVNKIAVMGNSAGGYLAQFLGVTSGTSDFLPEGMVAKDSIVNAVISTFGISNLLTIGQNINTDVHDLPTSTEAVWINGLSFKENMNYSVKDEPQKALLASPIHYVKPNLPPFLIMHGDQDQVVSSTQADDMVAALNKAKVPVDQITIKGAGHGTTEWIQPQVFTIMNAWLENNLIKN